MMESFGLQKSSNLKYKSTSEIPGGMENLITQIITTNFIENILVDSRYAFSMLSESLYGDKNPRNVNWLERVWKRNQENVQKLVADRKFSQYKHYFKWSLTNLRSSGKKTLEIKQKNKINLLKYLKSTKGIVKLKDLMIECSFYENLQLFKESLTFENLCKLLYDDVDEDIISLLKYYWFANVDNVYQDVSLKQRVNDKNVVKDVSLLEKAGGIDKVITVMVDHNFQQNSSLSYAMRVNERINKILFNGMKEPNSIWLDYLWKSNIDEIQSKLEQYVSGSTKNDSGPSQPKRQKMLPQKKGKVMTRRNMWKIAGSVENVVQKMIDIGFAKKMENKSIMSDGIHEVCVSLFGERSYNNFRWVKRIWMDDVNQVRSLVLEKTATQEMPYNWDYIGGMNCALNKMIETSFMESYLKNNQTAISNLSQKLFEKAGSDEHQWVNKMIKDNIEDICCIVKLIKEALTSYDCFLSGNQSEGKLINLMLDPSFSKNVSFLEAAVDLSMKVFGESHQKYIKCIEYIWSSEMFQTEYKQKKLSQENVTSEVISTVASSVENEDEIEVEQDQFIDLDNLDEDERKIEADQLEEDDKLHNLDDNSLWTMADGVNNIIKAMFTTSFNVYYEINKEEAADILSKKLFDKVHKKYRNWLMKIWDNNEKNIQNRFSLYEKSLKNDHPDSDDKEIFVKAGSDLRIRNCMKECNFPMMYELNPSVALKYLSQKVFHSSLYKYRLWLKNHWTSNLENI